MALVATVVPIRRHPHLGTDVLEAAERTAVSRDLGDSPVEGEIVLDEFHALVAARGFQHAGDDGFELADLAVGDVADGLLDAEALDLRAEGVDVVDVLEGQFAHEGAAAWPAAQEPALLQTPHRLADGIAADLQLAGQFGLVDPLAGPQGTEHEPFVQQLRNLVGQPVLPQRGRILPPVHGTLQSCAAVFSRQKTGDSLQCRSAPSQSELRRGS
jgi:hypothetical protein